MNPAPSTTNVGTTKDVERFFAVLTEVLSMPLTTKQAVPDKSYVFQITPAGSWTVDLRAGRRVVGRSVLSDPDCKLLASDTDFLTLLRGNKASAMRVFMSGGVVVEGDRTAFMTLRPLLAQARKLRDQQPGTSQSSPSNPSVDGSGGTGTNQRSQNLSRRAKWLPSTRDILARSSWRDDREVAACTECHTRFTFFTRRHHCRFCGDVFCVLCTGYRLRSQRCCFRCFLAYRSSSADISSSTMASTPSAISSTVSSLPASQVVTPEGPEERSTVPGSDGTGSALPSQQQRAPQIPKGWLERQVFDWIEGFRRLRIGIRHPNHPSIGPEAEANKRKFRQLEAKVALLEQQRDGRHSMRFAFALIALQLAVCAGMLNWAGVDLPFSAVWVTPLMAFFELATRVSSKFAFVLALSREPVGFWVTLLMGLSALAFASWTAVFYQQSRLLLRRRLTVYSVGIRTIVPYILINRYVKWFKVNDERADQLYNAAHRAYAPNVVRAMMRLEGFWIKVGQYMSSRADVMPPEWLKELSRLQDSVTPTPFAVVDQTIRSQFGGPIETLFDEFDPQPIAAASIAQVHLARLKGSNHKVVVKVQHPLVHKTLPQDMINLERIMSWVAFLNPDMDFKPVLLEWARESIRELDFRNEAANTAKVAQNMAAAGIDVLLPTMLPNMITDRVLVMEFMEGFKVTDVEYLDKLGIDRLSLLRRITEAYAHQIYVDGFFNADPHPGNILVNVRNGRVRPVLLDFGLTKALPQHMRLAFAKMVCAGADSDTGSLINSFNSMGLKFRRQDPMREMRSVQFMLRDTAPPKEMRDALTKFWQERWEEVRQTPVALRNPIEAWPGELLFFMRVTFLLRGLATMLEVRLPYLQILSSFARLAVVRSHPEANHAPHCMQLQLPSGVLAVGSSEQKTESVISLRTPMFVSPVLSSLESQLRRLLASMADQSNDYLGVQVCVYKDGRRIVDTCAGVMGTCDPRPVRPDSLFNCFSATKPIGAACLLAIADEFKVDLADPVAHHWREFACNGKEACTIKQLLSHQAGLYNAVTALTPVDDLSNYEAMVKQVAQAKPSHPAGERAVYHYLSFGWLVGGLIQALSNRHIQECSATIFGKPLGVADEFFLGLPSAPQRPDIEDRVVTVTNGFGKDGNPPTPEEIKAIMQRMRDMAKASEGKTANGASVSSATQNSRSELAAGIANIVTNSTQGAGESMSQLSLADPCMFNSDRIRHACIPAANGHFSARALAKFYAVLANWGTLDGRVYVKKAVVQSMMEVQAQERMSMLQHGIRWGLGVHVYGLSDREPQDEDDDSSETKEPQSPNSKVRLTAFGHSGLGGTLAFCDVHTNVAVAITVNKLTLHHTVANEVTRLICKELQMGYPQNGVFV